MSAQGMTETVLATGLAEAVARDEAEALDETQEDRGYDLSAGMLGRHVSAWIRSVAVALTIHHAPAPVPLSEEERRERTAREMSLLHLIAVRANKELNIPQMLAYMDITAVHTGSCPLRLQELLEADALGFTHDVVGIGTWLNRQTWEIEGKFKPRYAVNQ